MTRLLIVGLLGSMLAAGPANAALHQGGVSESDKKIEAQAPAEWWACQTSSDCKLLEYGCTDAMAANVKHYSEARDLAYREDGDPRAIKCLPQPARPNYVASCVNAQCYATNPTE